MATHSSRRPIPALVFLLALAVLAVVVWVRVADRDSSANEGATGCGSAPQLPSNGAVAVTVLNGVGTDGLATQVLDTFAAAGFAKGNVGDAPTPYDGFAIITSGPNGTAGALLVHYYLTGSIVTVDTRGDTSVTVTVGSKYRGLATAAQAKAAMVQANVSQSPAAITPGTTPGSTGGATTTAASPSPSYTCFTTPPYPTPTTSASPAAS